MNISSTNVAALFLIGGLATGGYFAFQAIVPPKLEDHIISLGLELANDSHWAGKEEKYKKNPNSYTISTITDPSKDNEIVSKLKKWCEKKKDKYFLGIDNLDYQKFSIWCLAPKNIKNVLFARGKSELTTEQKKIKVNAYNEATNTDKFINGKELPIKESDLTKWCATEENRDYEHEGVENLKKIINWCYSN